MLLLALSAYEAIRERASAYVTRSRLWRSRAAENAPSLDEEEQLRHEFPHSWMISDFDVYRAAKELIELRGPARALKEAAAFAKRAQERGDLKAQEIWYRIKTAILRLQGQPVRASL